MTDAELLARLEHEQTIRVPEWKYQESTDDRIRRPMIRDLIGLIYDEVTGG